MKYFKRLTAMVALAACTITATPAKAHHPEYAPKIVNYLQRLGVKLYLNSTDCGSSGRPGWNRLGWYRPRTNEMCIKDHSLIGAISWYRTLNHEAWHVIQDGIDGGIKSATMNSLSQHTYRTMGEYKMNELIDNFKKRNTHAQLISAQEYGRTQKNSKYYAIEWEARMVEEHPDVVLKSLKILCRETPGC